MSPHQSDAPFGRPKVEWGGGRRGGRCDAWPPPCQVFPFFNTADPGSVCGMSKGLAFLQVVRRQSPLLRPPGTVSPPPPAVAPIAVLVAQAYDVLGSEGMEPFLQAAARCAAGGADNDAADNDAGDSASNECVDMDAASLSTVVGETISCGNLKMRMPSMCDQDSVASVCCATCSS